jgi:lysozyme
MHIYSDSSLMIKKINQKTGNISILTVLLLAGIAMATFYIGIAPYRSNKFSYKGFGISMPDNYAIHGIDVSHYQSMINWQDVKQMNYQGVKIGFSFIKATEGTDKVDENYLRNWYEARQLDIPVGAYHFFYAGISGKVQAENFMAIANLEANDLPPVLDIEEANETSTADIQQEIQEWLDLVEKNYHVKPIIYTNINFYDDYLEGKFDDYPLWIANYLKDDKPDINRDWTFWQHSQTGHVNGIGGYVDFNVFRGDSADFKKLLIK